MAERAQLPDLPLMLAGVPRGIEALLHESGVPAEALPEVPLAAAGTGRFVLFDSHDRRSTAQARRVAALGLKPIDIYEFLPEENDTRRRSIDDETVWLNAGESGSSRRFLEHLKGAVESLGGTWVRIADYPFPYQSALCLAVEHVSERLADFAAIVAMLPAGTTHFVSSRLRADRMAYVSQAGDADLGWQILPADFKRSPRHTLSHWTTRMKRFSAANLRPQGLLLVAGQGPVPRPNRLLRLGLRYACDTAAANICCAEASSRCSAVPPLIRFGMREVPTPAEFLGWVAEHYQSGCPLFLWATTERLDLASELLRLEENAGRCSLLWQTTFGEFSRWWALRRQLRLAVWRTETGHEIQVQGEFGRYAWAVEIWRGNHLATLPLHTSELVVPHEGLVYLQSFQRNPSGCMIHGDSIGNLAAPRTGTGPNRPR